MLCPCSLKLYCVSASLHIVVLCPSVAESIIERVPVDDGASPEQVVCALGCQTLTTAISVHARVVEVATDEHILGCWDGEGVCFPCAVVV